MMTHERARITDVAGRARVSKATVPAVLSATATVRDASRQRVLAIVERASTARLPAA